MGRPTAALIALVAMLCGAEARSGAPVATVVAGPLVLQVRQDLNEDHVGRFNLGLNTGEALLARFPLAPFHSYTTVRVGGTDHVFGSQTSGTVLTAAQTSGSSVATIWSTAGLTVTQTLSLVAYPAGSSSVNMVEIEYLALNTGGSATQIGLRVMLDTMVGRNDGCPITVTAGGSPIVMETDLQGGQLPAALHCYDSLTNPTLHAAWVFQGPGLQAPDKVTIADWDISNLPGFRRVPWNHANSTSIRMVDSAIAIYWYPVGIGPSQTKTFRTYYGLVPAGGLNPGTAPSPEAIAKADRRDPRQRSRNLLEQERVDARTSLQAGRVRTHGGEVVPNPAQKRVTLAVPGLSIDRGTVRILDMAGREVLRVADRGPSFSVDVSGLVPGTYVWIATRTMDSAEVGRGRLAVRR